MYKISIVILIVIIILILGNIFISQEGFFQPTKQTINFCNMETPERTNDCSIIETESGAYRVHNVCPTDPRCLGVCVNDHTWTTKNKEELGNFDSLYNIVGELKSDDQSHLVASSRCLECVKNFYFIADIISKSKNCAPKL
jgi:hypothetical protein